ncbi:MAG: carbohydrate kinase family protein [bacterium]|nr:carbohydrate kinase family protein [bacterium]
MKYDIIAFGSATQDIYLKSKEFLPVSNKSFNIGKGICLPVGSKIKMDEIAFSTGGGGTNAAATFAKLGFKVAYCGMVGNDYFGNLVIEELKRFKIDTSFVKKTNQRPSNISIILSYPSGEKTILVYRGASDLLKLKDIPLLRIKNTRWFYLAPFAEEMAGIAEGLVNFAKKNKIRVALNPGYDQLTLPGKTLERILAKVDILILNQEEASLLTKIPYQKEKAIFKKLDELVHGICIMTKGSGGAVVSDGKYLYKAKSLNMKPIDTTGAGDSFNSGFLSGFIKTNNIPSALQLGIANSASCLRKLGAKQGLLKKGQKWPKIKVTKELCLENGICQVKI